MALDKQGPFTVGTPPRAAFDQEDQQLPGDGPPGGCLLIMAVVVGLCALAVLWISW